MGGRAPVVLVVLVPVQPHSLSPPALVEGQWPRLPVQAGWLAEQERGGVYPGATHPPAVFAAFRIPTDGHERRLSPECLNSAQEMK